MKILTGLQAVGTQKFNTVAESGDTVYITLYFRPAIQQWFMDLTSGDFELYGQRVCNSLNLLEQYSRVINFGIIVIVSDGGEPFQVNDFTTGRVQLGVLSESEIETIDNYYKELK